MSTGHDLFGHPGGNTLYKTLNKYFYIKNMKRICDKLSQECILCQSYKINKTNLGLLTGTLTTSEKMAHISSDIVGPYMTKNFKTSINLKRFYILTISDRCTRYSKIYPMTNLNFETFKKAFLDWINNFGAPTSLLTNQGKYYKNKNFINFCKQLKIKNIFSNTFTPQGNSISERLNQKINFLLSINKNKSLKKRLKT